MSTAYGYASALGAGVQALGSIAQGRAAAQAAKAQARVQGYNAQAQAQALEAEAQQDLFGAQVAEYDADLLRQASMFRERQIRLARARQQGLNRAAIGASGVTVQGSPLLVLVENAYQAEQEALLSRYEGQLAVQAREREGQLRQFQAAVRRQAAGQVRQAGRFGADITRAQGRTALTQSLFGASAGVIRGAGSLARRSPPTGATGAEKYDGLY